MNRHALTCPSAEARVRSALAEARDQERSSSCWSATLRWGGISKPRARAGHLPAALGNRAVDAIRRDAYCPKRREQVADRRSTAKGAGRAPFFGAPRRRSHLVSESFSLVTADVAGRALNIPRTGKRATEVVPVGEQAREQIGRRRKGDRGAAAAEREVLPPPGPRGGRRSCTLVPGGLAWRLERKRGFGAPACRGMDVHSTRPDRRDARERGVVLGAHSFSTTGEPSCTALASTAATSSR